jgi:RNase adaptor protein for sRNA GlmZ degradation
VRQFLANAISMVETSVKTYQSRDFKSLMVSFGCTGGQHRSVFMAEQLARHLRTNAKADVVVRHLNLPFLEELAR